MLLVVTGGNVIMELDWEYAYDDASAHQLITTEWRV